MCHFLYKWYYYKITKHLAIDTCMHEIMWWLSCDFLCMYTIIIIVNVKMPMGKTLQLNLHHPYPIKSVKQEIFRREGIPPHCQQLSLSGRVVEDGHTLIDYNIQYESTLDLVVKQGNKCLSTKLQHVIIIFSCFTYQ